MNIKETKAPTTTVTYNLDEIAAPTGNLFEAITIIAKRAEQINLNLKEGLSKKLEGFTKKNEKSPKNEGIDEIHENQEQIEIVKFYERLPKPTAFAVEEWLNGEIYYRLPEKKEKQE